VIVDLLMIAERVRPGSVSRLSINRQKSTINNESLITNH